MCRMLRTPASRLLRPALVLLVLAVWGAGGVAHAQQRPLVTQDPESIGAGQMLVEAGFDYGTSIVFPVSGLEGNLLRVPVLGVVVGVSSIAEIQVTGGPYKRLAITARGEGPLAGEVPEGDTTSSVEDLVIGAKVRLLAEAESRPAIAFRFATRLPNAGEESGIGLDTTDFYASLLVAKGARSIRVAGNLGLGILADPVTAGRQNDVLTYGVSLARAITQQFDLVGELNGRWNTRSDDVPPGTESTGAFRVGARFTRGTGRVDAGLIIGLTPRDPGVGFTAGFTYVFKAFTVGP
jgi:hypothetical protein